MVSAIIEDRKDQTRRVMNPQPPEDATTAHITPGGWRWWRQARAWPGPSKTKATNFVKCPYGQPGDILICKETHYRWGKWVRNGLTKKGRPAWRFKSVPWTGESNGIRFCVNETRPFEPAKQRTKLGWHKRPSIFMPLRGARLRLELVSVRVERLQEIAKADCIAEGMTGLQDIHAGWHQSYAQLWDSINARRDGGQFAWDTNPCVFALTFKKL